MTLSPAKTRIPALAVLVLLCGPAWAAAPQTPPYFLSLKSEATNMREGPSDNHRVSWVYHRKGLPVEVLSTYDVWRRVRDMDGVIGWIHVALLSRDRSAVVTGKGEAAVREGKAADSDVVAEAEPGAIGQLKACDATACEVKFADAEGWIDRSRIWGALDGERF